MSFSKKETTHKLSGMSKYYYHGSEEEIKVGDPIDLLIESSKGLIGLYIGEADENVLSLLAKEGYILKDNKAIGKPLLTKDQIPMDLDFYLRALIEKMKAEGVSLKAFARATEKIAPAALYDLLLIFIAKYLDEQYPDHIRESKKIFGIDVNGKVIQVDPETINTFKTFAAFRSAEDAGIACRILRPLKRDLFYKNGK